MAVTVQCLETFKHSPTVARLFGEIVKLPLDFLILPQTCEAFCIKPCFNVCVRYREA
jgi:hypothetical protein